MEDIAKGAKINETLKCKGCGALLQYAPGTNSLKCEYCGEGNIITGDGSERLVAALDYEEFIASIDTDKQSANLKTVKCTSCGSQTVLDQFVASDECPFCAAALVLDLQGGQQYLQPHYVLPFGLTKEQGIQSFQVWLKGLWWAPNDLATKVTGNASQLKGVYIPHWCYDTYTVTDYTGERGDYYYTTETYTETVNGKSETRTRQVRHTRWSYASGTVDRNFQDLLVPASKSLPDETLTKLSPWKFEDLVKFDERYLSGFRSETYQVDPVSGFELAAQQTIPVIQSDIMSDIGGDEQRIINSDTDYQDKKIKYLMLPVWASAYYYNNKVYQFTINASTGEVIGKRPYSWIKITLAILFVLALIAAGILYYLYSQQGQ